MDDDDEELEAPSAGAAWLASFADLMSLMLCFFVLLFSLSTVEIIKRKEVFDAIQSSFRKEEPIVEDTKPVSASTDIREPAAEYEMRLMRLFREEFEIERHTELDRGNQMRIVLQQDELFTRGSAEIRPERIGFVRDLASTLIALGFTRLPSMDLVMGRDKISSQGERSLDMRRAAVLLDAMIEFGVPQNYLAAGIYPFTPGEMEFYFSMHDPDQAKLTFNDVVLE